MYDSVSGVLSLLKQTGLFITHPKSSEKKQKDSIVISSSWPLRKCFRNSVGLLFLAVEIHWGPTLRRLFATLGKYD